MASLFLSLVGSQAIVTNVDVVYCHLKPRAWGALKKVFE